MTISPAGRWTRHHRAVTAVLQEPAAGEAAAISIRENENGDVVGAVDPDFQRKGLGRAVVMAGIRRLHGLGGDVLRLTPTRGGNILS